MTNAIDESAAYARLYDLLSIGFSYPDQALYRTLVDDRFIEAVRTAVGLLDRRQQSQSELRRLATGIGPVAHGYRTLESEYIALFELNRKETALHLNGHLYLPGKPDPVPVYRRLQEIYRTFGIELKAEQATERPDHLSIELEFMAYLYNALHLTLKGDAEGPLERIQRGIEDFYSELGWVAEFVSALEQRSNHPFYVSLGQLLRELIAQNQVSATTR